jgi:serine/threonine protein phosphatase 1
MAQSVAIEFSQAPASLPGGIRIYAVGDVHGCLDQLIRLHDAISEDVSARPVTDAVLLHVGDYIDRGPDSAQVIARLRGPSPVPGARMVNLKGNHEDMLLTGLDAETDAGALNWLENGGRETLASWSIRHKTPRTEWIRRIPPQDLDFLRALPLTYREGGYLFVHAGIRPAIPLENQEPHDLMWIREPFLSFKGDLGVVVVHGHTPRPTVAIRSNRIGIDTGAVYGGRLTCAVLESDRLGFLIG